MLLIFHTKTIFASFCYNQSVNIEKIKITINLTFLSYSMVNIHVSLSIHNKKKKHPHNMSKSKTVRKNHFIDEEIHNILR